MVGNAAGLEWAYDKMYKDFMEGIDGNDNGVEIADQVRYKELSSLPHRVDRLNSRWNEPADGPGWKGWEAGDGAHA